MAGLDHDGGLPLLQVLIVLHNDEGYQQDVGDSKVTDAILTHLKKHPDQITK